MRRLLTCGVVLGLSGGVAMAQDRRPIEVGLGISSFGMGQSYEGVHAPGQDVHAAPDVRITFSLSPRFSVEEMVTFTRRDNQYAVQYPSQGTYRDHRDSLIFSTQVKQRIEMWTRGGFHPFLLYGAGVYSEHQRVDYSLSSSRPGTVQSFQSYTSDQQWIYGVFGAGVQQQIGRHVAVRADVTALGFLSGNVRASVGVSIPLGSYK